MKFHPLLILSAITFIITAMPAYSMGDGSEAETAAVTAAPPAKAPAAAAAANKKAPKMTHKDAKLKCEQEGKKDKALKDCVKDKMGKDKMDKKGKDGKQNKKGKKGKK